MRLGRLFALLLTAFLCGAPIHSFALDADQYAVDTRVSVSASPPQINISWPSIDYARQYTIRRKSITETSWSSTVAVLPGSATGVTDANVSVGSAYEYEVQMDTSLYPWPQGDPSQWISAYTYIYAGINAPLTDYKGKIILVVDNSVAPSLAQELSQFQQDLVGAGWSVIRRDVDRNASPWQVREIIRADYNADPGNVRSVFLVGHVPVPYSGAINPDLHPSHLGAWPADVFYGEMNGNWTDSSVSITSEDSSDNNNYPGDGKFDQSTIPSEVELEVGRIDFWGLPAFSSRSEVDLLRNYFAKDHQFRFRQFTLPRRGLVHDNFGDLAGDAPAVDAWRHFGNFFGPGNTQEIGPDQFFPTLNNSGYLWAYGCGGGGYDKADGVGTTADFASGSPQAAFLILHGSYFGDWNNQDNFLRAAIASRGYTLASIWSGLPHWFMHHMALGKDIGYSTRISQNNTTLYKSHINLEPNEVHIALMGDPTLEMFPVIPASNLSGSGSSGGVALSWSGSGDENIAGYNLYYSQNAAGPFTRVNANLITTTSYNHAVGSGTYYYMVRAVKLEHTGSGTFYNASQGVFTTVTKTGGGGSLPIVNIAAEAPDATEGSAAGRFRISRDSAGTSDLTINFSISGTALNGADYVNIPQSITIPSGGLSAGIIITPYADAQVEGDETVTLSLNSSSSYNAGASPSATVTIHDVSTANQRPTISPINDQSTVAGKQSAPISFTISDAETSADQLSLTATSSDESVVPDSSIVLGGSGGTRTIQMTPIKAGKANITISVSDGNLDATRNFYLTVTPANTPPVANPLTLQLAEGSSTNLLLSGSDAEGSTLSFAIISPPAHGTLTGTPPNLTYTPTAGFSGADSFSFKVNDGMDDSPAATVSIVVIAVNHAPTALPLSFSGLEDTPLSIVLSGTDPDSDPLSYFIVSPPAKGKLSGTAPNLLYTPNPDANGNDSFTYKVNDGKIDSAIATVTLSVSPVNDAPVILPPSAQAIHKNSGPIILSFTVSDLDDSPSALKLTATSNVPNVLPASSLVLGGSGAARSLTITPILNATGLVQITLAASDGKALGMANFNLLITNTPPIAQNDLLNPIASGSTNISTSALLANDSDADGDSLVVNAVDATSAMGGTVLLSGNTISYTPKKGFTGFDAFNYTIADASGATASATVSLEVKSVARLLSISPQKDGSVLLTFTGPANKTADILATDDSLTWQRIGTALSNNSGNAQWRDTHTGSTRVRLYRIEWP